MMDEAQALGDCRISETRRATRRTSLHIGPDVKNGNGVSGLPCSEFEHCPCNARLTSCKLAHSLYLVNPLRRAVRDIKIYVCSGGLPLNTIPLF